MRPWYLQATSMVHEKAVAKSPFEHSRGRLTSFVPQRAIRCRLGPPDMSEVTRLGNSCGHSLGQSTLAILPMRTASYSFRKERERERQAERQMYNRKETTGTHVYRDQ